MATQTDIVNIALGRVGSFTVTSINENSAEARQCLRFWDNTRRTLLRDFDFNFSTKWTLLSQISGGASFDYDYCYALPSDYLRALMFDGVHAGTKQVTWQIAGGRLYTDQSDADYAKLEYIRDVTDCTEWDDAFVNAFSYYLAAAITPSIKNAPELALQLLQAGNAFLKDAKGADTQEDGLRILRGVEHSRYQNARAGRDRGNFMLYDYGPP